MQCRPQGCVKCMAPIDRGMTMWVCMCRSWVQAIFECGRHDRDMTLCAQDRCRGGGHVCVVHGAMVQGSGVRTVQGIDKYRHGALCRHAQVVSLGYKAENEPARGFDVFRWKKRKKGYGFLSYHCHIPVRYCLT